jgi:hypothetical protein
MAFKSRWSKRQITVESDYLEHPIFSPDVPPGLVNYIYGIYSVTWPLSVPILIIFELMGIITEKFKLHIGGQILMLLMSIIILLYTIILIQKVVGPF